MEILLYIAALILLFSAQTTLLPLFQLGASTPDLGLALAFYCGSRVAGNRGIVAAGIVGFVQDCLSGGILGVNTLSKSLIGMIVANIKDKILVENYVPIAIFLAGFSIFDGVIFYLASSLLLPLGIGRTFFGSLPLYALYNGLIGPAVFFILKGLHGRLAKPSVSYYGSP